MPRCGIMFTFRLQSPVTVHPVGKWSRWRWSLEFHRGWTILTSIVMKKILFVEDNALIAGIYSQKLVEVGFEVAVAEDGLAAMKMLPEFKPDLVVLDLMMPKLTGADVLKFMRQHAELKFTRVIVFSNSFLSDLVEQISSMAVERTLVKAAVNPARLVEVINQVLAAPSQASAALQAGSIPVEEPANIEPPAETAAAPVVVAKQPAAELKKEPDPE